MLAYYEKMIKDICKSRKLFLILKVNIGKSLNLARIKYLSVFIRTSYKVQKVGFEKIAIGFETIADAISSRRRVQRLFASAVLDMVAI